MAGWSADNATKAYLGAMNAVEGDKEPSMAGFISAMAAGNNARFVIVVCRADAAAEATVLALQAAVHETGGRIVCISNDKGRSNNGEVEVDFVAGNAENMIKREYNSADCIVVDCRISNSDRILKTARTAARNALILGYNATKCRGFGHLLPIGDGLLVSRPSPRWVVKIDEFTGEEHIFMLRNLRCNKIPTL